MFRPIQRLFDANHEGVHENALKALRILLPQVLQPLGQFRPALVQNPHQRLPERRLPARFHSRLTATTRRTT